MVLSSRLTLSTIQKICQTDGRLNKRLKKEKQVGKYRKHAKRHTLRKDITIDYRINILIRNQKSTEKGQMKWKQ